MTGRQKKPPHFPDTRWSLLHRATTGDESVQHRALDEIIALYAPALRTFLVTARRIPSDLASDFVNDFVISKVITLKVLKGADREKGKFRNYLLKSLNNFVTSKLKRESEKREREIPFDDGIDVHIAECRARDAFDAEWVRLVVHDALRLMELDCRDRGRNDLWEIFEMRVIGPVLDDVEPIDYGEIVKHFHIQTPRQAMNLLATAKRNFVRNLRLAISRYVSCEKDIDIELEDLRRIAE